MRRITILVLFLIFAFKVNLFSANSKHAFSMVMACHKGDFKRVKELYKKGASVNSRMAGMLTPALTSAAARGHYEIAKFLIDKGADVNLKAKTNETALMAAAGAGIIKTVKLLLDKGAKVNVVILKIFSYVTKKNLKLI